MWAQVKSFSVYFFAPQKSRLQCLHTLKWFWKNPVNVQQYVVVCMWHPGESEGEAGVSDCLLSQTLSVWMNNTEHKTLLEERVSKRLPVFEPGITSDLQTCSICCTSLHFTLAWCHLRLPTLHQPSVPSGWASCLFPVSPLSFPTSRFTRQALLTRDDEDFSKKYF